MKKFLILLTVLFVGCGKEEIFNGTTLSDYEKYALENKITFETKWIDSDLEYGRIVSNFENIVSVSNGSLLFKKNSVDELGRVPIMMYHGIVNETPKYTGGNIDVMGYNRSVEAFKSDLEFYYKSGYRAIRLIDYINGEIDVPLGLSPIVLTFDDGNINNFKVLDYKDGKLVIDPSCAIGIMEEFKKSHPDFNMTATFFLHSSLFSQKYNKEILNWLVDNGYDIGNHTYSHSDLEKLSREEAVLNVDKMYDLLKDNIGNKYVNILSLPFGKPYLKTHPNFEDLLKNSVSTLRVGWESNNSPFSVNYDKTFIKRIRAYDNNGLENDIASEFKKLEKNKFISDGNKDIVTIKKSDFALISTSKKIIIYEE